MAEKGAGMERVSPPEAEKVRVVRCPKCGRLLPELDGFKVYRCGGCNATLQAKKRIPSRTVLPVKSEDEKPTTSEEGNMRKSKATVTRRGKNTVHSDDVFFLKQAGEFNGSPASGTDSNDYKVVSDEDGTIKSDYPDEQSKNGFGDALYQHPPESSNSRVNEWDESKVFPELEDTVNDDCPAEEILTRNQNQHYLHATNAPFYHSNSSLSELDRSKAFTVEDDTMSACPTEESRMEIRDQHPSKAPFYHSNPIETNPVDTRENQYKQTYKTRVYDVISDKDENEISRMQSNKMGHDLQGYGAKKVQPQPLTGRGDSAMRPLLNPRGSSQGKFSNREKGVPFDLPNPMYNHHEHQDPNGFEHLEQDRTETLKMPNGIKNQLGQPFKPPVKEKPSHMASSSNFSVPKNPYTTKSDESFYETSSPLSHTSLHYNQKHDLDSSQLPTQDNFGGYAETFGSQAMQQSRAPYQNPIQQLQRQSTNFSYEQFKRKPGELQTHEASYHQPSFSYQHSNRLHMLSRGPTPGFRSRDRSYVSKNSSFGSADEHTILQSGNAGTNSSLGSYSRYMNRSRNIHVRGCRPLAGASPFIMCHNCFELLQLPYELLLNGMHQKRLECGSCLQVITFKIAGKRLILYPAAAESTGISNHVNEIARSSVEFRELDPAASQYRNHGSPSYNGPPVNGIRFQPSPTNTTRDSVVDGKREGVSPSKVVYQEEDLPHTQFYKKDLSDSSEFSRKSRVNTVMPNSIQSELKLSPEVGFLPSPPNHTHNSVVQAHYPGLSELEETEGDSPTSKISDENVPNAPFSERDVQHSQAFSSTSGVVISKPNLSPNEYNLELSAEICNVSNSFEERISINKNSTENKSVSSEKKSPISDHSISGVPQNSTSEDPKEEYNNKFSKGGDTFITGIIKKSLSRSSQILENGKAKVSVNGHTVPDRLVKKAEKMAGTIQPGEYWYDYHAGFWGVIGQPCLGIIPPYIEEFNYPMAKNCSAGNTAVFVNGRELHSRDLTLLAARGLPTTSGRSYIIEISGAVKDASSGVELGTLGKLAPTIEKLKKGFGMKPQRVAAA